MCHGRKRALAYRPGPAPCGRLRANCQRVWHHQAQAGRVSAVNSMSPPLPHSGCAWRAPPDRRGRGSARACRRCTCQLGTAPNPLHLGLKSSSSSREDSYLVEHGSGKFKLNKMGSAFAGVGVGGAPCAAPGQPLFTYTCMTRSSSVTDAESAVLEVQTDLEAAACDCLFQALYWGKTNGKQ